MPQTADTVDVVLDGSSLTCAELATVAHGRARVMVAARSLPAVSRAHDDLLRARAAGTVYGANTGVGANRSVEVGDGDESAHGLRLLRSHASGVGALEDDSTTIAAMVIRLNQLLAARSGISPAAVAGLADAIAAGALPTLHETGSVGTGDLTALAELALTLKGELPWRKGGIPKVDLADSDSLPFMSSSAVTVARSALAATELTALLEAATVVTSMSFLALRGSSEAYDARIHAARRYPGQERAAARLRALTETGRPGVRLQDPFGLRVAPQVQAPADEALARLVEALELEMNAGVENPHVLPSGVLHHGQFHLATLGALLDATRVAILPVVALSAGRLTALMQPSTTGLRPFLSAGPAGSSGLMILEYVAQDALSTARTAAQPATGASISVSLGLEEHASFAPQSARLLETMIAQARVVLAVELVAAVRALRFEPARAAGSRAQPIVDRAFAVLPPSPLDRPMGGDVEIAVGLLPELVALADFAGDFAF